MPAQGRRPRREALVDALGLAFLLAALTDYLRPSLLLLPTIAAGGDTPSHYPTAVFFHDHLLPRLRLHGWYAGAYLGHPLLLYYFPLPFLAMSALAPFVGLPVAFKLGSVAGAFLLPLFAYACFRLMSFRFPGPLLAAGAAFVFLLVEDNPIWGGTLASTLTGEFAYTYGIGLALLFLGAVYRAYARGASPLLPAALLALVGLAHGYAVLWAGPCAAFFLYQSRRPLRTLAWLAAVALVAAGLAAFWLLPLAWDWRWTTPFDDPWITVGPRNLVPPLLLPLLAAAVAGLAVEIGLRRRSGGVDRRLLFLFHASLCGAAFAAAGPALGIVDVRFAPFAQLALCLAGAAALGLLLQEAAHPGPLALGLVVLGALLADASSTRLRYWADWNYTGLEAKELWPAFRDMTRAVSGTLADPRVAVEYSSEHEKAGSIRMYETLPLFAGRSTLEGLYNQASLNTHAVYYLTSELAAASPNPFRNVAFSGFDTESALRHLRLFNADTVVALSPRLVSALSARDDVREVARVPPYLVFRLSGRFDYVEPLSFSPVRSDPRGWRAKAQRWLARRPASPAHLVFTRDPRFAVAERDEWLSPPEAPLDTTGVVAHATVEAEAITIETSRPGHPLLVKASYHPRWRAEGADGPYLASPALMVVIPRARQVRLLYAESWTDQVGRLISAATLLVVVVFALARRRGVPIPAGPRRSLPAALVPLLAGPPARRWGGLVPGALLGALLASRLLAGGDEAAAREVEELRSRALRAQSQSLDADAAEYAGHALARRPPPQRDAELRAIRGRSLLRLGRAQEVVDTLRVLVEQKAAAPPADALELLAQAYDALGHPKEAAAVRARIARPTEEKGRR